MPLTADVFVSPVLFVRRGEVRGSMVNMETEVASLDKGSTAATHTAKAISIRPTPMCIPLTDWHRKARIGEVRLKEYIEGDLYEKYQKEKAKYRVRRHRTAEFALGSKSVKSTMA
jgi:hypothetical protein